MTTIIVLFWILLFVVFYAYLGYGILLYILVRIKRLFAKKSPIETDENDLPHVTLFITAFNEAGVVEEKMKNTLELDYPKEKLHVLWITDGSDDGTPEKVGQYPDVVVSHLPERKGKIAAMNRGMGLVETPLVVFCDANTLLGKSSVRRLATCFFNPKVGCVSGEKRILNHERDAAAAAGEGLYWKYESKLKKWDSELYSVVGAAGELFALRTDLFEAVEPDTLLDDFIISLRIAQKGYVIQYDPEAYAAESASANVQEEFKRKVRISAGGIQSVVRLKSLLNPFKYGILSFQYISHRVLRWTLAPLALPFILILNTIMAFHSHTPQPSFYLTIWVLQLCFYLLALLGWYVEHKKVRIKILFVPYYFVVMNLSVFFGFFRYIRGKQSVNWERAKRG